ncbi:MAG: Xaa-Pro peptidase family protein [Actinomycetota bacterium]|nr:Xaa-Pro peptidase family protein [Actinomycetota bacterium]
MPTTHAPTADRLDRAQRAVAEAGWQALLVSAGTDMRYLTAYNAHASERLTCLVVPAQGAPLLVVPVLEAPMVEAAGTTTALHAWSETDDPFAVVAAHLREIGAPGTVGIGNRMWAEHVRQLTSATEGTWELAGPLMAQLRMRKDDAEAAALLRAGQAIDRVHARMAEWLLPGRNEREVGKDIAEAIVAEGHEHAEFIIVGSGPNAASPHHLLSDRVIGAGDMVVVDIGGVTEDGYCSDSTRTYLVGGQPTTEMLDFYAVLQAAQDAACLAVTPGVTAEAVDATAREIIAEAGYGPNFIHRTGHGIGLDVHEDPYIVSGNDLPLEPGMAFSVEPGIYFAGRFGARIEDIVICTADGVARLNVGTRDLMTLGS